MIDTTNIEQAKKLIKSSETPILVKAQNPEFDRKALEYGKFDILLFEKYQFKFSSRNIDSGINEILSRIASKNKVAIGFDLSFISNLNKKEKSIYLARIKQNIRITRKTATKLALINILDTKNALSLLTSLGASTKQTSEAILIEKPTSF